MTIVNIVGGGLSGTLVAYFLKTKFHVKSTIRIFEKSRHGAGRLTSWGLPRLANRDERSNFPKLKRLDLGAQQVSFNSWDDLTENQRNILCQWQLHNYLEDISGVTMSNVPDHYRRKLNFMFADGGSQAVEFLQNLAKKDGDDVGHVEINYGSLIDKDSIAAKPEERWVVTAPAPQAIPLVPDLPEFKQLNDISYFSRICLGILCRQVPNKLGNTGIFYLTEAEVPNVRYICVEKAGPGYFSMCVHSNVPFGLKHAESSTDDAGAALWKEFQAFYDDCEPVGDVIFHKWKYSQIYRTPFKGQNFINHGNFTVTGDAFAEEHNILGTIESAYQTAAYLAKTI